MSDIIEEVKSEIKPQKKEEKEIKEIADRILNRAKKESPEGVEVILVGSVAKGTFLVDVDIDIFIKFPMDADLKKEGLDIARKIMPNGEEVYASHPYLRGRIEERFVDIVPCYNIDNIRDLKSAVDRTPFHTEYIKKRD